MAFFRLVFFGFLVLGVLYICISLYSRSVRREKLENEWDTNPPERATPELRESFIDDVFVIPPFVVGTIIYLIN